MLYTIQQIQLKQPEGGIKSFNSAGKLSLQNTSCIITYSELQWYIVQVNSAVLEACYQLIRSGEQFELSSNSRAT